jgi:hypothetical protein
LKSGLRWSSGLYSPLNMSELQAVFFARTRCFLDANFCDRVASSRLVEQEPDSTSGDKAR